MAITKHKGHGGEELPDDHAVRLRQQITQSKPDGTLSDEAARRTGAGEGVSQVEKDALLTHPLREAQEKPPSFLSRLTRLLRIKHGRGD